MENWRLKETLLLLNLCGLKRQRNCGYVLNRCLGMSSPYMPIAIRVMEVLGGLGVHGREQRRFTRRRKEESEIRKKTQDSQSTKK